MTVTLNMTSDRTNRGHNKQCFDSTTVDPKEMTSFHAGDGISKDLFWNIQNRRTLASKSDTAEISRSLKQEYRVAG